MEVRRYLIPPNDEAKGWRFCRMAKAGLFAAAEDATREGKTAEIIIRRMQADKTDPQRRTLWKWHGEVAAALSISTPHRWKKEDVHEIVFLPKFMPTVERVLPDGEVVHRPLRTSDRVPDEWETDMKAILSKAMDAYMAWAYQSDIEITVPEGGW
ncbi:MAG: hypothetical protein ABF296_07485 [Oceanococcaceae bacterium]